jgi:hypothetical protein
MKRKTIGLAVLSAILLHLGSDRAEAQGLPPGVRVEPVAGSVLLPPASSVEVRPLETVRQEAPIAEAFLTNAVFRFQLIQAEDGAPSDPRIAEVEAALRGLLRFTGYRLVAEGIVQVAGGGSRFSQILDGPRKYSITGTVSEIRTGSPSYARVEEIILWAPQPIGRDENPVLLETTLNVRHGQVIVVGSVGSGGAAPMLLTVNAEIDRAVGSSLPGDGLGEEVVLHRDSLASHPGTWGSASGTSRSGFLFEVEGFNRIEGLSVRLGPTFTTGGRSPTQVETTLIWRSAGRAPFQAHAVGYQAGVERWIGGKGLSLGAELFSRIDPVAGWAIAQENSLSAFLLSLDHGDYFERRGGRAILSFAREGSPLSGTLDFTRERIGSVASADPWSLLHSGRLWRDQPLMAEGDFRSIGGEVTLDTRDRRDDPTDGWFAQASWRRGIGGALALPGVASPLDEGEGPSFPVLATKIDKGISRFQVDLRRYIPVSPGVWLNLRGFVAGSPAGARLPPHLQHALGGLGTLPGHSLFAADCGARKSRVQLSREGVTRTMIPYFGCDGVALFQAEYNGTLKGIFGRESLKVGAENLSPHWTFFFDAGKGWASSGWGPRSDSPVLYDAGVGLLLGKMGVYWAKPLGKVGSGSTLTLRLGRRF